MSDVIRMALPICLHLREEVGAKDALGLTDGILNQLWFLTVSLVVIGSVKVIEACGDSFYAFILSRVSVSQSGNGFSFEIRQ